MKIAGVYLAAGSSSRMGSNKLAAACRNEDFREPLRSNGFANIAPSHLHHYKRN